MKNILRRIEIITGYSLAIFVILFAILIILSRFLTPFLDRYRPEVEQWGSQLLNMPLTIQHMHVSWLRYQPGIDFAGVTIFNQETNQPALQVKNVSIFFSIPQSLWQKKLVPNSIKIDGTKINVHQSQQGEWTVQGIPVFGQQTNDHIESEIKIADVAALLTNWPYLLVKNIDVHYSGFQYSEKFFTLKQLNFYNEKRKHYIYGEAILHQDIPTNVTTAVEWSGQELDLQKITANVYFYTTGLSLSQWFGGKTWQSWQVQSGIASTKIWARWENNAIKKIQTKFQIYHLNLYSLRSKLTHPITRLSGNVSWKQSDNKQIIIGDDLLIDLPDHLWPITRFYISFLKNNGELSPQIIQTGYVDLQDIQSFLFSTSPLLSDALEKQLAAHQLQGGLDNVDVSFSDTTDDWRQLFFKANFIKLSFLPWNGIPGIKDFSGDIKWDGQKGVLHLDTNRAEYQDNRLFQAPFMINRLSGTINFQQDENQQWNFNGHSLQILNDDISLTGEGSVAIPSNTSPSVDIRSQFTVYNAANITRYLPLQIFDQGLNQWLRQAFLAGEVNKGEVKLQGVLTDFPFDQGQGTFLITGDLKNLNFRYAPNWPLMKHASGKLVFSGRKMTADIDEGEISEIPLAKAHGEIASIGGSEPSILQVTSEAIKTDFSKGLNFVRQSPLNQTIGKMFTHMTAAGPIALNLALTIPLKDPGLTKVQGDFSINQAQVNVVPWKLSVKEITGLVNFTENTTNAKNIQGKIFNRPISINLQTLKASSASPSIVQADFSTPLKVQDLENWLKIPFSTIAEGQTQISGEINFAFNAPIEIDLQSNLAGVKLTLPDPYGKGSQDIRNLFVKLLIDEDQPVRVKLNYADILNAALVLARTKTSFQLMAANLQLGKGDPAWPEKKGLYLTGQLDVLDWDKIKSYMDQSTTGFEGLKLIEVNLGIKKLNLLGQLFSNVQLQLLPLQNSWEIDVKGAEVSGHISAPKLMSAKGNINADFDKLHLKSAKESGRGISIDVKSLPAITFHANDIDKDGIPLGEVNFKTVPTLSGLSIQRFNILSPNMSLVAKGSWTNANVTHIEGEVTSSQITNLLNSFGLNARNFIVNKGKLDFNLNWHDSPFSPELASMSGSASLNLGPGRIVDIGQASERKLDIGRMLSIFSLQTIPRRLMFDFSDIFQKGYSFDFIRGDFTINRGNAYTNNLRFDGPVAGVSIKGRIGLKNKDYDFLLGITPYVTSSVPVVATLVTGGNPIVGIAAFGVGKLLGSQVSKVATYQYAVRGPWNNPSWTSLSTPQKK
ncbi:MAG: TIGR02099 family protein [Gammaproteobacteria bacterium RIFCSPHIGHO2_12_FULL_38_14]|nr:MAG: TIGR02099 family protein [Gammaproteobacteria bacterium RIFCSPHIGHO2_12_FULL_38_14]